MMSVFGYHPKQMMSLLVRGLRGGGGVRVVVYFFFGNCIDDFVTHFGSLLDAT